ncbi:complement C1q tumor necrosis factor-related protein 6-like [Cyprinodon tularosa]|uniref:complement C1q tumor necrosis factor-related protein 6-like n=1 Tax=Cyprinodon tularosa TaxID=77115 RepID=UPI0018E25DEB|nr:complement C1q tumor necrosis factor-related protein 6-like [Cyprinodon tularosa]
MRVTVVALTLFLFCLSVAESTTQPPGEAGDSGDTVIQASNCQDCCTAEGQTIGQFVVLLREIETELRNTKRELEELRSQVQGTRVAFGASISVGGNLGPYNTEITLIYKRVYVNTGSFNRATGIFTAPVRGIYYFSFSGHNVSSKPMGLRLMKNGQQMVCVYNHVAGNRYETATNGMTLQLEVGDQIYMRLRQNTWIYDNSNDHSTFVGHLLFPL